MAHHVGIHQGPPDGADQHAWLARQPVQTGTLFDPPDFAALAGRSALRDLLQTTFADALGGHGNMTERALTEHISSDRLNEAAATAVGQSSEELARLERQVQSLVSSISAAQQRLGRSSAPEATAEFNAATEGIAARFEGHFSAQRQILSTFNIALFGRTGAGKSTLLSALGQLDGTLVSPGDSDWTVAVEPIDWHGCRLFDTPGINGWGRTRTRSELEETARRAVEVADVVLLCFDTQSQQASEFEKVSQWVRNYGKPVMAVLNVRTHPWRLPDRAPARARRVKLSLAVRQHADHIAEELERIGLPGVPVVAMHSQRALAARAQLPYRGPNSEALMHSRALYGEANLREYSNYPILEALIAEAIVAGGADLRTTALREGIRQLLDEFAGALERFEADSQEPLQALDRGVQSMLDVLGYPDANHDARHHLWSSTIGGDALETYETSRLEPFTASRVGSYHRHVQHLLQSGLSGQRSASQKRAERLVIEAFSERRRISDEGFSSSVMDPEAVETAVDKIWRDSGAFLTRELNLAAAEGVTDVRYLQERVRVRGDAGAGFRYAGHALRAVGVVGNGIVAALMIGAALNLWNPVGWTALLAGGVAAGISKWFGGRAKREAEKQKVRAREQALATARRAVNDYFDDLEARALEQLRSASWSTAGPALRTTLESGAAIRATLGEISALRARAEQVARSIAASPRADQVLAEAVNRVVASHSGVDDRHERPASVAATLLGEQWIEQAEDTQTGPRAIDHPDRQALLDQQVTDYAGAAAAVQSSWSGPNAATLKEWLDILGDAADEDPQLAPIAEHADGVLTGLPRIAIVGDYSSGKSSLIKRLLVDAGLPVPDTLSVRADPTTQTSREYRLRRVVLVDTPGFQSGDAEHDRLALESVADAVLVVYVLHNNLLIGDPAFLDRVLKAGEGRVGKLERTLFLINRSDGITGGDPGEDPAGFLRARRRREAELVRALRAHGIDVPERRILSIASDPFGAVGDAVDVSVDDYDLGRDWDGMAPLRSALQDREPMMLQAGRPIAAVEGASCRLQATTAELNREAALLATRTATRRSVLEALGTALRDAETIELSLRSQASALVDLHARRILNETLGATDDELPAMAARLEHWWEDPVFLEDLDRFYSASKKHVDEWYATHSSAIGREVRGAEFRNVSLGLHIEFQSADLKRRANAAHVAKGPLGAGQKLAGALGRRDAFYALGKRLHVKFKPWGAVKGAQKVAKVGAVLAVVGIGLDAAEFVLERRDDRRREQAMRDAVEYVNQSTQLVVKELLRGRDSLSGPLGYLEQLAGGIKDLASSLEQEQQRDNVQMTGLTSRRERVTALLELAREVLDAKLGEEPSSEPA